MLQLIARDAAHTPGYREYCAEMHDRRVIYFVPTNPARIDGGWFERTKGWYDQKELGPVGDVPRGFHYWAVVGGAFVGEFQLRPDLTEQVMTRIGSVGYAVRPSLQGRGYGTELLRQGLSIAREKGLSRVLLNINAANAASLHVCEKLGGVLMDTITGHSSAEGDYPMRRYWIAL